jgi:hypothetical protein
MQTLSSRTRNSATARRVVPRIGSVKHFSQKSNADDSLPNQKLRRSVVISMRSSPDLHPLGASYSGTADGILHENSPLQRGAGNTARISLDPGVVAVFWKGLLLSIL